MACGARTALLAPAAGGDDGGGLVEGDGAGLLGNDGGGLPPVRVVPVPEGTTGACVDAGTTRIYVVTQQNSLLSFYPPAATFAPIGRLSCPVTINADATPYSMAVDRAGTAYVLYRDVSDNAELFRVSTVTASCVATGFIRPFAFGMGYSTNPADGGEVLYVATDEDSGARLATIDTRGFALAVVGAFEPLIQRPELTGTGAGDLFAFYAVADGSAIAQVDKSTAQSLGQSMLAGVYQNYAWAFGLWGGDFYTFTSPGTPPGSAVTRFRPSDGSIVQVAHFPEQIVGAGVSTCAPQ
jgi:hypothetical protein